MANGSLRIRQLIIGITLVGVASMVGYSVYHELFLAQPIKRAPMGSTQPPAQMPSASQSMGAMGGMGIAEGMQEPMMAAMQRLQAEPNDVDALLDLADLFMQQGSYPNAQGFINRAMVAAPSDPRPAYYLGVLRANEEKYAEAAEAMERSLNLGDIPATRYSLAIIYIYHLNNREQGRAHLEQALQAPELPRELQDLIETELAQDENE